MLLLHLVEHGLHKCKLLKVDLLVVLLHLCQIWHFNLVLKEAKVTESVKVKRLLLEELCLVLHLSLCLFTSDLLTAVEVEVVLAVVFDTI